MKLKAVNGNVLVKVKKNVSNALFSEANTRKDIQYAEVVSATEGSKLKVGDIVCFNPRALTTIPVEDELMGALNEGDIRFIVEDGNA